MRDYVVKAILGDKEFLAMVASSTKLVEEATEIHQAMPTAAAALGRALTLVGIMGITLKGRERISIQILSQGPIREIFVQSDAMGHVRGYIKWPHVHLKPTKEGKLDVEAATGGEGMLYVVRDLGFGEPYVGSTALVTGGIAKDLAYYFTVSEGIPSAVGAGVYVGKDGSILGAGGFIVQKLPEASESSLANIEKNIGDIDSISKFVAAGGTPEDLLYEISRGLDITILEERPIKYQCGCSRERAERALLMLGLSELIDIYKKDKGAEVKCAFCGRVYKFNELEIKKLIDQIKTDYPPA